MPDDIRRILLEVIEEKRPRDPTDGGLQSGSILNETATRLRFHGDIGKEQALLTVWDDLFRSGQLAWGLNLSNREPPFCHLTDIGRKALSNLTRDPVYPDGYLAHLKERATISQRTETNLIEALGCYNANLHKAAAVMLGVTLESIVLELVEHIIVQMDVAGMNVPSKLKDWRLETKSKALERHFDNCGLLTGEVKERYETSWPVFRLQIRKSRNDAGHPVDVSAISQDSVHASFLLLPELAWLAEELAALEYVSVAS